MATIIHKTDKRSGITYAYESISYWDKDKKQINSETIQNFISSNF